jgi:hypothetical protein
VTVNANKMETQIKRISKKQEAINSFLREEKLAIENRKDYVPIKDLDFLVSFDGYLTYEGNVLYKYLKENGYQTTEQATMQKRGRNITEIQK